MAGNIKTKVVVNGETMWLNRNGKLIPERLVQPHLRRRDKVVEKIITRAVALNKKMAKEKELIYNEALKYIKYLERVNGVDNKSVEGNLSLSNFSNTACVDLTVNNMIEFDEQLNVAKSLIDNCMRRWTKNANVKIKSLIDEAFNIDKKGRVNKYMILRLTKLKMNDKEWDKAVSMILDSQQITGTRQYLTLRVRRDKDSKWVNVNLNFSSLENQASEEE